MRASTYAARSPVGNTGMPASARRSQPLCTIPPAMNTAATGLRAPGAAPAAAATGPAEPPEDGTAASMMPWARAAESRNGVPTLIAITPS